MYIHTQTHDPYAGENALNIMKPPLITQQQHHLCENITFKIQYNSCLLNTTNYSKNNMKNWIRLEINW